ncbi:NUDIX domain-containing protein [Natronoflexus pectinivorans]|uniref:NUDIX domain-containing protein n=1 Tax=Natronoflexus pectinivorans TaxID=682526 RepID=A0A4R2GN88_9BACT|nr:NUDIX domain-containing protein [Natronoflexus pectinivorans]TCO09909.1 NUDIX domain-containing protein [Natronoflexus pectinivorans]
MTDPVDVIKYCPKCGSPEFFPDNEKSFTCGGCGFNFYVNSAAAVAALIFNEKGELLLTRRALNPNKGMLDLPGGFVDPDEKVEDAVIREINEELNLEVTSLRYLVSWPNRYIFSGYTVFTIDLGFVCEVKTFDGIGFHDDISGYEFIAPHKIDNTQICSESIRQIIDFYRRDTGKK